MKFIDISAGTFAACDHWDGCEPEIEWKKSMERGDWCNRSAFSMPSHWGTHLDAPFSFFPDGETVDCVAPENCIGPCTVMSVDGPVTGKWVEENIPFDCERLLIRGTEETFIMESAAFELAQYRLKLLGINRPSVSAHAQDTAASLALLENGIVILEGLCLDDAADGEYFLIAPPLKNTGAESAPVRAVLVSDYIFWSPNERKWK